MHTLSSSSSSSSTMYSLPKYPRYYCHFHRYFEYVRRSKAHSTYIPSWLEYTSHFRTSNPLLSKSFLARLLTFLNRPRYDHALYPRISSHALSFRGGFSFYNQPTSTINGALTSQIYVYLYPPQPFSLPSNRSAMN